VGVLRFLVVVAGFLALLALPCWLALITSAQVMPEQAQRILRRLRRCRRMPGRSWSERRHFARLDRSITQVVAAHPAERAGPPIEQVAADLRRLARQRLDLAGRSAVWHAAIERAYDDRLATACRELRLEQHLAELSGVDLEIERVRVEGTLQRAGLPAGNTDRERRWHPG
jgi:hypothetical protein